MSGMVLVGYQKAFDMADHERLLKKLEAYGRSQARAQFVSFVVVQYKTSGLLWRNGIV